jgi:hypothetical protein
MGRAHWVPASNVPVDGTRKSFITMALERIWSQRALWWLVAIAGAAFAVGCSGGPTQTTASSSSRDTNQEHLGDDAAEADDEIDELGGAGADGQEPAALDQGAPPVAARALKADQAITSSWDCFGKNGRFIDRVGIWWGNTATDGTWACNEWRKERCSAAGGCVASGGSEACNVLNRTDGCSLDFLNDPTSNAYKDIFRPACDAHDICYQAPWDRIASVDAAFNKCNDNFWIDMSVICTRSNAPVGCAIVASAWATAMNVDPGRGKFFQSFANDQIWKDKTCQH